MVILAARCVHLDTATDDTHRPRRERPITEVNHAYAVGDEVLSG
jgi:hypothetical protein